MATSPRSHVLREFHGGMQFRGMPVERSGHIAECPLRAHPAHDQRLRHFAESP